MARGFRRLSLIYLYNVKLDLWSGFFYATKTLSLKEKKQTNFATQRLYEIIISVMLTRWFNKKEFKNFKKPHRNIEKKSFKDQFLVEIAVIFYTKMKCLNHSKKTMFLCGFLKFLNSF